MANINDGIFNISILRSVFNYNKIVLIKFVILGGILIYKNKFAILLTPSCSASNEFLCYDETRVDECEWIIEKWGTFSMRLD